MKLEELTDRTYGPVNVQLQAGQVAAYVAATGDDPTRWTTEAPPSFASALLFAVAPLFLTDPIVRENVATVLHGEQTFTWHRPLEVGQRAAVSGRVERVRSRSGASFITFRLSVLEEGDVPLVDGVSLFVASQEAAEPGNDAGEPNVEERGVNDTPALLAPPVGGEELAPFRKSASRSDLVRYAGSSHDWNPIHWDHGSAVAAGLEGVIVHGLLSAAWITQATSRYSASPRPLSQARFRFRSPLRPAVDTTITGQVLSEDDTETRMRASLESERDVHVTAEVAVTR